MMHKVPAKTEQEYDDEKYLELNFYQSLGEIMLLLEMIILNIDMRF
jgi:hypothetical protein